jgi:hypothetical protein
MKGPPTGLRTGLSMSPLSQPARTGVFGASRNQRRASEAADDVRLGVTGDAGLLAPVVSQGADGDGVVADHVADDLGLGGGVVADDQQGAALGGS